MPARTYKFRLYPNHEQSKKLHRTLGACRWLYNKMIEKIRKEGFQSRNDLNYFLTELKESDITYRGNHGKSRLQRS
jgi:putative transposase